MFRNLPHACHRSPPVPHRRNRTAWAEHWRHGDRPRPTLLVIHGFAADPYWVNSRFLALPWFYEQGYDVMLVTLPFHGRRQEVTSPYSGHGWFSHGFCHMNETMAHAIHDIRVLMDHLEDQGVPQMGVTGISLGGYTSALLASVDNRLTFAVPNVPVVSIMDIVLEWLPAGWLARAGMALGGISVTQARAAVAVQSALSFKPLLPPERLMLVAGLPRPSTPACSGSTGGGLACTGSRATTCCTWTRAATCAP